MVALAFGSGSHWPSTTKRYSCLPGLMVRSPTQRPLAVGTGGVFSGFPSLKEPATKTLLASGLTSSSETCPRLGASGVIGTGLVGATCTGAGFEAVGCATAGFGATSG